jgi:hypothetical protein
MMDLSILVYFQQWLIDNNQQYRQSNNKPCRDEKHLAAPSCLNKPV